MGSLSNAVVRVERINTIIIIAEMGVISRTLATSNEGDMYGL